MGQGRKKSDRSGRGNYRRHSLSSESDNRDSEELRILIGATAVGRTRTVNNRRNVRRQYNAAFFKQTRHNSLVDYISPQSVNTIPVKPATFEAPLSTGELPLISTSPETRSGTVEDFAKSRDIQLLMESLFPNNTVYMNGKGRDITPERSQSISSLLRQLLAEMDIEIDLAAYATQNRKDFIRCTFFSKISRVLSSLVHGCRYENTYGFSTRAALLLALCTCLPDVSLKAYHTLYETLIDFNESERGSGLYLEDEIFLQDTTYGQIHRLVELWQSFVNSLYEKWSTALFSGVESPASSLDECHVLFRSCVVLLRTNGVVKKYRSFLVPSMLKLFYIDEWCVRLFTREITTKWPVCTSKKAVALLELVQELLESCEVMMDGKFEREVTQLLGWLCKLVNGSQAEISMQAIQILDSDQVLIKYIVCKPYRVRMVEHCLSQNHDHWNEAIREVTEALFDHLLDYL